MSEAANIETPVESTTEVADSTPVESSVESTEFSIPEAYAERNYGEKIKSNDDLWKAYDNSQKLIGDRGAHIPKDGATDEEISSFIDRLDPMKEKILGKFMQAPESYEFSDIELPEGVSLSDDLTDEFSQMAKDQGLTNAQADGLRKSHIESMLQRETARQDQMNEQFEVLGKEMWGGDYEAKLAETMSALEGKLDPAVADALWNAEPSVLIPIIALKHAEIQGAKPDTAPSVTTSHGKSDEQLISERRAAREAARRNPTKENIARFNDTQERSRGKR